MPPLVLAIIESLHRRLARDRWLRTVDPPAVEEMVRLKNRVGEAYLAWQAAVAEYESAVEALERYEEKEASWRIASMRR